MHDKKDPFQENSHESDSSTNVVAGYLNLEYMNKHFLFICISLPQIVGLPQTLKKNS